MIMTEIKETKFKLLIIDESAELVNDILGINRERAEELLDHCIEIFHKNDQLHACLADVVDQCNHINEVVFGTMIMNKIIDKHTSQGRLGGLLQNLLNHE